MVLLALSLSLSDQVQKYGAYVGIAAFFGLGVLSLLYFAQAREVKRLREWAGRAPERAREVEEAALAAADAARRRPPPPAVAQPQGQPVVAATAAGGRSGTVSPAVPVAAGTAVAEQERPDDEAPGEGDDDERVVEGPATADGTRPVAALPPAGDAEDAAADGEPEAAERDDEDPRDEAEDADADEGAEDGEDDEDDEEQPAPAAGSPSNGAGAERPVFPRPSTAAGVAGAGGATAAPQPAPADAPEPSRAAPAMPLRAGAPTASPRRAVTMPPRRPLPPAASTSSGHGGRRWAIAGGVAAVIAALGVFAATQLIGNGKDKNPAPNQAATPTPSATTGAASSGAQGSGSRGDTTVAVFNGTTINGLAASTADKLVGSGYKRGSTGDYTDQQRAASTIFYRRDARRQARDIGRELHISDMRAMDAETQALAGDKASVAVVVGSDKAP